MNEKEELKTVHTPHDRGCKRSLSQPREFLHFLKKYVKADWMLELEESQLSLCDKEFVDKDYEGREADLIYRVKRTTGEETFVFILQELQSTVDYTMIFRILIYVVNNLLRYFLNTAKVKREGKDFRLPAMVPIVFYNGESSWTAVRNLRDCDKFRRKYELAEAIRTAYDRIQLLGNQEKEEFNNWVKTILLSVCGNREAVVEEILRWTGNGVDDMAFKYNIIKVFEDERAEGMAEGKAESIIEILEESGIVPEELRKIITEQRNLETLGNWLKKAAHTDNVEEFQRYIVQEM